MLRTERVIYTWDKTVGVTMCVLTTAVSSCSDQSFSFDSVHSLQKGVGWYSGWGILEKSSLIVETTWSTVTLTTY